MYAKHTADTPRAGFLIMISGYKNPAVMQLCLSAKRLDRIADVSQQQTLEKRPVLSFQVHFSILNKQKMLFHFYLLVNCFSSW